MARDEVRRVMSNIEQMSNEEIEVGLFGYEHPECDDFDPLIARAVTDGNRVDCITRLLTRAVGVLAPLQEDEGWE